MRIQLRCPICNVKVPYAGRCEECDNADGLDELIRADEMAMQDRMVQEDY